MTPQTNAHHMKCNLIVLCVCTMGFLAGIAWQPDLFYIIYDHGLYLVMHTLLEFISNIVSFSVFAVAWYSWKQSGTKRDLIIAITFLNVGILDLIHTLSYAGMPDFLSPNNPNKAALFWIAARIVAAIGLFIATLSSVRKNASPVRHNHYIIYSLIIVWSVIVTILYNSALLPAMYIDGYGQTNLKILLEYTVISINAISILICRWKNPSRRFSYFLRIALTFSIVGEIALTFYSSVYDIYNLLGHIYKVAAYYFILIALFEITIVQPYDRITRLVGRLRNLSLRNIMLYKQSRESQRVLENTMIQLGATLASKQNVEEVFEQIVRSTAAVFSCGHVFLSLAEQNPLRLKPVAWVSSFAPPEELSLTGSFMGKVFSDKETTVIDNIMEYPDRVIPGVRNADLQSILGVPIVANTEIIGVLELFSRERDAFSEQNALLLKAFAQHAGEAIRNAKLYEETLQSLNQLSLQYDIVKSIAAQNCSYQLLKMITEKLDSLLHADGAVAFIMHHRNDGLHTQPVYIRNFPTNEINHLQQMFSNEDASWPWVSGSDENGDGDPYGGAVTMSILIRKRLEVLPLQRCGTLQGLVVFAWDDTNAEIPSGLEITLRTIAAQTAIALERTYLYENVKEMALSDALTKLPNRRQFDISLSREMNRTRIYARPMCLMLLDIDFFKKVNDTYGHLAGDEVLRQLGVIIKDSFRATDMPARYGGEEFAVILPETDVKQAKTVAEEFRLRVQEAAFDIGECAISVTISIGIATFDGGTAATTADQLIEIADAALYDAKQNGRNCVSCIQ